MISFESDYNNGMLPEILEALGKTNSDKTSGYGFDPYSRIGKRENPQRLWNNENAEVFFLIGGTQTNTTVIDSVLMGLRRSNLCGKPVISRYMNQEQ